MNEFERLWGWAAVPHQVRVEKEAWNDQPVVSSSRPDTKRSIWGEFSPGDIRRLKYTFVKEQAMRGTVIYDPETGEKLRDTYEGRITRRKGSHIKGGRQRNWIEDHIPRHVLGITTSRFMFDGLENLCAGYEPDSGGLEEIDWTSLARVNASWQEPTIASIAAPALLKLYNRLP